MIVVNLAKEENQEADAAAKHEKKRRAQKRLRGYRAAAGPVVAGPETEETKARTRRVERGA